MSLDVQNLAVCYGRTQALDAVSFHLGAGDLLLVTGPNGSGKSTLLRALAGLVSAPKGAIAWNKAAVADDLAAYQNLLCFIGHLDALKPELSVREMAAYWAALMQVPSARINGALEKAALMDRREMRVRHLSAGQKRRLSLSRLFLSDAPLWLLDEPVVGLDRASEARFLDQIEAFRAGGGIVVIALHHALNLPRTKTLELGAA